VVLSLRADWHRRRCPGGGSWLAVLVAGSALAVCRAWIGELGRAEWLLAAAVVGGGSLAAIVPARRLAATTLVVGPLGVALVLLPAWSMQQYLPDDDVAVTPRCSRRFVRVSPPRIACTNPSTVRWSLLRISAARYLAVAPELDLPVGPEGPPLVPFDGDANVHVYSHGDPLPRAYYVPRHVALVEAIPPSGFTRVSGNDATAPARFTVDEPEHLVVELEAPERGFLFVADQYFPGWSATVNGRAAPIVRANHTFRLVEVPSGRVRVELRCRPVLVPLGAGISVMTLVAVAIALRRSRARRA